jgi:hypothetical protein
MHRGFALMCVFMMASLGCQASATSIALTESAATPVAAISSDQPLVVGSESVWGEVPKQCA